MNQISARDYYFYRPAVNVYQLDSEHPRYFVIYVASGARIRIRGTVPTRNADYAETNFKIGYNEAIEYREWSFSGGNPVLNEDEANRSLTLYVRLDATLAGTSGMAFLSTREYDIDGYYMEEGEEKKRDESAFYIPIGTLSAPDAEGVRSVSISGGTLGTDEEKDDPSGGVLEKMFVLKSDGSGDVIVPQLPMLHLVVRNSLTLAGTLIRRFLTSDYSLANWESNEMVATAAATAKYIKDKLDALDSRFLRKDIADTAQGLITFSEGIATDYIQSESDSGVTVTDDILAEHSVKAKESVTAQLDVKAERNVSGATVKAGDVEMRSTDGHVYLPQGIASTGERSDDLLGEGFHIYKDVAGKWIGYIDNLYVRQALMTLELAYERVKVNSGTVWNAPGAGKVLSVVMQDATHGTVYLDLQDGEIGSFAMNDLCLGIYHFDTGNATEDSADGLQVKGFKTVYFRVGRVYPSASGKDDNGRLTIIARNADSVPCARMSIVAFGNMSDTSRQSSAYETRTFKRYLFGIDSYEKLGKVENIAMQLGDLSNLTVEGKSLSGYSAYLNNVYFRGIIQQLKSEGVNILNWRGDWAADATYTQNDQVLFDGQLFVYKSATDGNATPSSDPAKWAQMSEKATGMRGAVIRTRGEWKSGTTYYNNETWMDVVLYDGNFFRLKDGVTSSTAEPKKSSDWIEFSLFDSVATSVLLANKGYVDILGAAEMFVGDISKSVGWVFTNGSIKHTMTGLELTSDGRLDVGKSTLVLKADQLVCVNNSGEKTLWLNRQGDLAISGNYYNMTQEIIMPNDYELTQKNTHLLIPRLAEIVGINYGYESSDYYCLDVLHCGSVLSIRELHKSLVLPCYVTDTMYTRTYVNNEELTSTHLITRDEMRQILGKEIIIYVENEEAFDPLGKLITGAIPDEVYLSPISEQQYGVLDIINGNINISRFDSDAHSLQFGNGSAVKAKLVSARIMAGSYTGKECYYWQCQAMDSYACEGWR